MKEEFALPVYVDKDGKLISSEEYKENEDIKLEDYTKTIIKGIYDENPPVNYPMITVFELDNSENTRFSTAEGEKVSNLSYQIDCYSRQTETRQATESVMLMGRIVNRLLGGPRYKMNRVGTPALMPLIQDKTVIKYSLRYTCVLELDTNTIYKN